MKAKIRTRGIVLKLSPYGDTSGIVRIFSREQGLIGILAKGIRKATDKTQLIVMQEYEFELYSPSEAGLYLFCSADPLNESGLYLNPAIWAAAESGIEILENMEFSHDETTEYYDLLQKYLSYLEGVKTNGVLIYWRFFLRVLQVAGLDMQSRRCALCGGDTEPITGIDLSTGSLVCDGCGSDHHTNSLHRLSAEATHIFNALPEIGNHLAEYRLNAQIISEINDLFLSYWNCHYSKPLRLKSLGVLSQFYPG